MCPLSLVRDGRRVDVTSTLSGSPSADKVMLQEMLTRLRDAIADTPPDPYLLYATTPTSTERDSRGTLPDASEVMDAVVSDRAAGRITGMTRFASFWVEGGELREPLDVMRFDDSLFRMLGSELEALTTERDLLLSGSTYEARNTSSFRTPGALLRGLKLAL